MSIVLVAGNGRSSFCKLETVTWETELLKHHRLAVFSGKFEMPINILVCVFYRYRKVCVKSIFAHPAPVVWPYMDVHIIDIRTRMNLLVKIHAHLASPRTFTS